VRTNLANSLPLTSFVGRERPIAELKLLLAGVRLLTLVGVGGIGKTRLAERVASDLVPTFVEGVWLVELAALSDPDLVPHAVVASLDLRERPGESALITLCGVLAGQELLLVLDNCEHLVAACAELVDRLLRACPRLRVLATSREPLGVEGETIWRVPSLEIPAARATSAGDEIAASEAVRLFLERTRSTLPGFALTDQNAASIAMICQRLDGIPLAIELAAARVNALGVEQIVARLDDRFRLLKTDVRSRVIERHRTLRATVEWSHDLLSEAERRLFRRLSVFAGGWSLEAAEAVCSDVDLPSEEVVDLLTRLVDRSLVVVDNQETAARYRLLETLRQYAAEHLESAAEVARFRERHRDWFLSLARRANAEFNGPRQTTWIHNLEREHDNARAALRWCLDTGAVESGLLLATAYAYFWEIRGHLYRSEARRWFSEALAGPAADIASSVRARALYWAGSFAAGQFDFAPAATYFEEDLRLCERLGDKRGMAEAQLGLGQIALNRGEYESANELLSESLRLSRELDDTSASAVALRILAATARALGDAPRALELATASLAFCRLAGDSHQAGHVLDHVGEAERECGQLERSAAAHREAVELLRAAGCEEGVNTSVYRQAQLARARGDAAKALELTMSSLRGFRELGHSRDLPANLELIGELVVGSQPLRAIWLFAAAEATRETLSSVLPGADRAAYEAAIASARHALGHAEIEAAWAAGRASSTVQAIELALASGEATQQAQPAPLLSPREMEVAALVARGNSNKEIAEALVISVRTAEAHVTNVLNKLGLRSRAQLAVWATEHRLVGRS